MEKVSAHAAGYMELRGAKKDGDCDAVNVPGGISLNLGCCNLFDPKARSVDRFRCEDCSHHVDKKPDNLYG